MLTDTDLTLSFRVVEITPDTISGDGIGVAIGDVQSLEIRRQSVSISWAGRSIRSRFIVLVMLNSPFG